MPGMIILLIDGREPKEEHYQSPVHASMIVRRWNIAYRLATKKHYITIIPDIPEDGHISTNNGGYPKIREEEHPTVDQVGDEAL